MAEPIRFSPQSATLKNLSRIKIVSDGTGPGTHFYDRETGEEIEWLRRCVKALTWRVGTGSERIATLTIEVIGSEVELEVEGSVRLKSAETEGE